MQKARKVIRRILGHGSESHPYLLTIGCLLMMAACDRQPRPVPEEPPTLTPAGQGPMATPAPTPAGRVTIHYHRRDENYEGAGLWTWDSAGKNTPKENELAPAGHDDFGPVFQLDRADYGGSARIGLLPRFNHNWSRKDGGDRFWTPALGPEVWILGGKNEVLAKAPDLSPRIEGAFIDGPRAVVLNLSRRAAGRVSVIITDQDKTAVPVESVSLADTPEDAAVFRLSVLPKTPLDAASRRYRVQVAGFGPAVALEPRGVLDDPAAFLDADARLGAACTPQGTTFRVFAPTARAVEAVVHDEAAGGKGAASQALRPLRKGVWEATVPGDLRGKFYAYSLTGPGLDPAREALDPYAVNAVANSARGRIGELPAPPRAGPRFASPTDMVIYEMHVRDFTVDPRSGVRNRGRYLGFTESGTRLADDPSVTTALDHLSELGVTHVELLPVQDFDNDEARPDHYNWGYVPTAYFSPEGAYATRPDDDSRVREFRALVEALHARGIGVIMDVVYNHTAANASFQAVVPGYYYRHLPDGAPADGAACGNEFRTEAPMARKLIVDSLVTWATAYGVDGFRFDLMALIDQETMRQAERALHAVNPGIVLFGEPWTAGATPLREKSDKAALRQLPVGAFNDDFRNALKGSPDGRDPGFIQNGSNRDALQAALGISAWFGAPGQSINYLTCHDNLVLWDKLKVSMPGADDRALEDTMKLGYLTLFTSQGVPFLHGGEEFARSKGGNNNSYNAPDAVNMVDWSLKRRHLGLYKYTRDVIALRKAHPVFRLRTREEVAARLQFADGGPGGKTLVYTLDGRGVPGETWKSVCIVLNGDDQASAEVALPAGRWAVAVNEGGPALGQLVSGQVQVPRKAGWVLYQP